MGWGWAMKGGTCAERDCWLILAHTITNHTAAAAAAVTTTTFWAHSLRPVLLPGRVAVRARSDARAAILRPRGRLCVGKLFCQRLERDRIPFFFRAAIRAPQHPTLLEISLAVSLAHGFCCKNIGTAQRQSSCPSTTQPAQLARPRSVGVLR